MAGPLVSSRGMGPIALGGRGPRVCRARPCPRVRGGQLTLPDVRSRELIHTALDDSILVEAGAGSGKTTELVRRMVALVESGVDVERIAAVTFTRKAAGELRERFQDAVEDARLGAAEAGLVSERLDRALRSMDRAFMGTIHAFCARLLRERPLEAGLDPAFRELTAQEAALLSGRWWHLWLERLAAEGDPALAELDRIGIRPEQLRQTFERLSEQTDVQFPRPTVPRPEASEIAAARAELENLMDDADRIFPEREPDDGWDDLQRALRTAWFHRRVMDWDDDRVFLDVLTRVLAKVDRLVQKRWGVDGHFTAKVLKNRFEEWAAEGTLANRLVSTWLAHRYPAALGFALRAAHDFADFRRRSGQLSFHDLLVVTAELLRGSRDARTHLGRRYTRLLVDEFQDTDPLQAEILFLLASEPRSDDKAPDWTLSLPRPGALFVVGDPKQSIYRFRRADIALYQKVRERFETFGLVVSLTATFRSLPGIAALVNDVFGGVDRFPTEATEHQAPFAPLEPVRTGGPPSAGVFVYEIPEAAGNYRARPGAERPIEAAALAGWIRDRVDGDREPGDFLILTRTRRDIDLYARALEERNLPVDVSGAGVGIEEEVRELEILLRALADPDDPVYTVAALTGLFFGLDLDRLLEWREGGDDRRFDLRSVPAAGAGDDASPVDADPVRASLGTLHRWWLRSREQPSDVVVAEIVEEAGLVPYAAAGVLGNVRAGALGFVLDAIRSAGLDGDTSLVAALEALATALADDEAEAPLEPGRERAVRLMNLHKAKGLEAPVVVLANPYTEVPRIVRDVVERGEHGAALGWFQIGIQEEGFRAFGELARPMGWQDKVDEALRFEMAEEVRLLYVAATRARDELVITRPRGSWAKKSPWAPFHDWADEHASVLQLEVPAPIPRDRLEVEPSEMERRVAAISARLHRLTAPTYSFETVTARVHDPAGESGNGDRAPADEGDVRLERLDSTGPGGFQWGSAVHAVLEAAARGLNGDALRSAARTALVENDRPMRDGEPAELDVLLDLVERVRSSDLWSRSEAAPIRLVEQPFVLAQGDGRFLEGVIDLVFKEETGWVVVDYKTDRGDAPDFAERMRRYRGQVRAYADAWARITGEPTKESLVWTLGAEISEAGSGTG